MRPLFCRHCGTRLTNEQALFCEVCGNRIEEVEVSEEAAKTSEEKTTEKVEPVMEDEVATVQPVSVEENAVPGKKPLATWIISLIVFAILMVITGLGVLFMYLKPSVLPSINPWYVEEDIYEDDVDEDDADVDSLDEEDADVNDEESNSAGLNNASKADDENDAATDSTGNDGETDSNAATDEAEAVESDSQAIVAKEYVAGDDTKELGIHSYIVVLGDYNWDEAYYDSRKFGDNAYLVHFNSNEEYEYVCDLLKDSYSGNIFWIGARRDDSYVYKWANAKNELVGDNLAKQPYWLKGEPSFYDVSVNQPEDRVDLFYSKTEGRYVMNDVPNDLLNYVPSYSGKIGYIVEVED